MQVNQRRRGRRRVVVYLDGPTAKKVREEAVFRQVSQQSILASCVLERYDENAKDDISALIAARLNKIDGKVNGTAESCKVISESLLTFVRMWLAYTPELSQDTRDQAVQSAQVRFEKFMKAIAKGVESCGDVEGGVTPGVKKSRSN